MTLQETVDNQELAALDLSKVAALQQKRTLAFVNHFVLTTVQFMNNFMKTCEYKLMKFERKLEKVDAAMVLLEVRLASIPELDITPEQKPQEPPVEAPIDTTDQSSTKLDTEPDAVDPPDGAVSTEQTHPEYDRFVKMVQVGVPLEAVKLKLSLEGLDPNVFSKIMGK